MRRGAQGHGNETRYSVTKLIQHFPSVCYRPTLSAHVLFVILLWAFSPDKLFLVNIEKYPKNI